MTESRTRKKLTKSARYLFFDLGVRRAAAEEAPRLPARVLGVIACRTPRRFKVSAKVTAIPWQEIPSLVEDVT